MPSSTKSRNSGTSLSSVSRSAGRRAGKSSSCPSTALTKGVKFVDPLARLGLTHGKEHSHDLLQGIALEVKQDENQLGSRRGQLAFLPACAKRPLAWQPIVAVLQPTRHEHRFQTQLQTHELRPVQGGQGPQKPLVAQNCVHVHALTCSRTARR